jgi:transcriptional regulator with XRE-family HTH domain
VTYTHYELGKRSPDLDTLLLIAAYYRVSTDFLLGTTWLRPTLEQWLSQQAANGETGPADDWPYPLPDGHPGMKIADT